jgi:hypothetical protein
MVVVSSQSMPRTPQGGCLSDTKSYYFDMLGMFVDMFQFCVTMPVSSTWLSTCLILTPSAC